MTSARKLMSRFTARVRSDLARAGAEQDTVNVAQVRALAAGMPERYRAAVVVAVGTGLRVSEVAGLAWGA
jgi:integrase